MVRGTIVDTKKISVASHEQQQENLRLAAEIQELETNVQYCLAAGIEWLEVSEDLLKHFNKGKLPDPCYFIYKNVKLVRPGTAEGIAAQERLTCHQILFKDEGYMKVR